MCPSRSDKKHLEKTWKRTWTRKEWFTPPSFTPSKRRGSPTFSVGIQKRHRFSSTSPPPQTVRTGRPALRGKPRLAITRRRTIMFNCSNLAPEVSRSREPRRLGLEEIDGSTPLVVFLQNGNRKRAKASWLRGWHGPLENGHFPLRTGGFSLHFHVMCSSECRLGTWSPGVRYVQGSV